MARRVPGMAERNTGEEMNEKINVGTPAEVYHQGGLYKDIFDASARSMNAETINKFIVSA